jgi:Outer membrane protein
MIGRLYMLLALLALPGCLTMVGPDYEPPEFDLPDQFDQILNAPVIKADAVPPGHWWAAFDDDQLNSLIDEVLQQNLALAAAQARVDEAQALLSAVDGLDRPTLDAGLDGDAQTVRRSSGSDDIDVGVGAGLLFGWLPDLFGGQARQEQAARALVHERIAARDDLKRQIIGDTISLYLDYQRTQISCPCWRNRWSCSSRYWSWSSNGSMFGSPPSLM